MRCAVNSKGLYDSLLKAALDASKDISRNDTYMND